MFLKTRSIESEMRQWLKDWQQVVGIAGNIAKLNSAEVKTLIQLHYPGGVAEFRRQHND